MPKSTGKFGSLRALRPVMQNITEDVLSRENQGFKYRDEERLISDRKKAEKEELLAKDKEKADKYAQGLDKIQLGKTGNRSYDERLADLYLREGGIKDRFNEVNERLEKNPNDKEAIVVKKNLFNSASTIKKMVESIAQRRLDIQKGITELRYSPKLNEGILGTMDGWFEDHNYKFDFNDLGEVKVINEGYDKNNDGVVNELDELGLQDVLDPNKLKPQAYFGKPQLQALVTSTAKMYGKKTGSYEKDGKIIDEIGFDMSKLPSLLKDMDSVFGEHEMNGNAKSFIVDMLGGNLQDYDEKKFKDFKASIAQRIIATFDNTHKEKTDWKEKNYDLNKEKLQFQKNKDWRDRKDKKDKDKTATSNNVEIMRNSTNGKPLRVKVKNGDAYAYSLKPKKVKINEQEVVIDKLYLDDSGNLSFDSTLTIPAYEEKKKTEGKIITVKHPSKKIEVKGGGDEDLNIVARAYGFKDQYEMKNDMETKLKNTEKQTTTTIDTSKY